jgi:F420-0:gamma-glutamyl ligase
MLPPKDDIYPVLDKYLPKLKEGDILFITSKVLGIHQGRCTMINEETNKDDLIKEESDYYISRENIPNGHVVLTMKESTLIPSAGIDESNGNGYYVFWPENSAALAKEICRYLKKKHGIKKLAVIVTDSHTVPLRYGVVGISTGFFGLEPLYDYRGKKDIFGRKLKCTKTNIVDALATMAVLLMGEGKEQTPMVVLRGATFVKFTNKDTYNELLIPVDQDIYYPLFSVFKKNKK